MDLKAWLTIALFATYFIYCAIDSAKKYKEQKEIQKKEYEKNRQAMKECLQNIIKEIKE